MADEDLTRKEQQREHRADGGQNEHDQHRCRAVCLTKRATPEKARAAHARKDLNGRPVLLGEPIRRSNFGRRVWAPAIQSLGLDGLRFHDLRHTAVAMAISQGAHPKTLQQRMGHSSVTVTLDRYGHLYDGLDMQLADGLNALLMGSQPVGPS